MMDLYPVIPAFRPVIRAFLDVRVVLVVQGIQVEDFLHQDVRGLDLLEDHAMEHQELMNKKQQSCTVVGWGLFAT